MSEFNAQTVVNALMVQKSRLDEELEVQPVIMWRITEKLASCSRAVRDCKDRIKQLEAELSTNLKQADPKATVGQIDAQIQMSTARQQLAKQLSGMLEEEQEWSGLLDCWKTKGHSIRELSLLYQANYWTTDSISKRERPSHDQVRADLQEKREAKAEGGQRSRRRPADD
jgi:hypothetical protein